MLFNAYPFDLVFLFASNNTIEHNGHRDAEILEVGYL